MENTQIYILGEVYKNIEKLFKYRHIDTKHKFTDIDTFSKQINSIGYIIIEGVYNNHPNTSINGHPVFLFIMPPDSKYATKTADFRRIWSFIPSDIKDKPSNIIFITESDLSVHVQKAIQEKKLEFNKSYIENYSYKLFIIDLPKHSSTDLHSFASHSEIDSLLHDFYKTKDNFPRIYCNSDPMAVWIGARPGDVIKIIRKSETAGIAISYRIAIRG